jgi:hypothetical protein
MRFVVVVVVVVDDDDDDLLVGREVVGCEQFRTVIV